MKHKPKPVSIPMSKAAEKIPVELQICARCMYYEGRICRRKPPTVFLSPSGKALGVWPPVESDSWCGEWSANG